MILMESPSMNVQSFFIIYTVIFYLIFAKVRIIIIKIIKIRNQKSDRYIFLTY